MKKNLKGIACLYAAYMMAAMANRSRRAEDVYGVPGAPPMTGRTRELLKKQRQERNHRLAPVDLSEREFVIRGERIMAHDKRTAQKIYARRHPETDKRKKRRK